MKKRVFTTLLAGVLVAGSILPSLAYADDDDRLEVTRVRGSNRYQTAVEISKRFFDDDDEDYVAIATGESFIDGLVGGTLTAQEEFPLLLTQKNQISKETLNEIDRLDPEEVFILGGEGAVSNKVVSAIKGRVDDDVKITRLSGKTRYETAKSIGLKRAQLEDDDIKKLSGNHHLISGTNFADALAAAPFLAERADDDGDLYPLIPYNPADRNPKGVHLVFGGPGSVPVNGKKRYAGKNRYETAIEIAKAYERELDDDIDTIVLVSGEDFPDGLASAAVAAEEDAVILLTQGKQLNASVKKFIETRDDIDEVIIIGGEGAISKQVENTLRSIKR